MYRTFKQKATRDIIRDNFPLSFSPRRRDGPHNLEQNRGDYPWKEKEKKKNQYRTSRCLYFRSLTVTTILGLCQYVHKSARVVPIPLPSTSFLMHHSAILQSHAMSSMKLMNIANKQKKQEMVVQFLSRRFPVLYTNLLIGSIETEVTEWPCTVRP